MSFARTAGAEVQATKDQSNRLGPPQLHAPLVSIIVTNYNYEKYIGQCLQSAVTQTYENIEVIVVDDVSTDGSVARISEFIGADESGRDCQLVALEKNGGQMNAFFEGLKRSSGTFIVFLDADDLLFPDFVETHVRAHLNPEYVAGLSCSNEVLIDQDNLVLASSIEKWHRHAKADFQLAPGVPVRAVRIDDWKDSWELGGGAPGGSSVRTALAERSLPLLFVEPDDNQHRVWLWSTTSAVMFRRSVLEVARSDDILGIRICADYFLFHFCHLIGGTILIQTPHGAYRRHGDNNFAKNLTIGRGSKAGTMVSDQITTHLNGQIERTFRDRYDQLLDLTGELRMLQIIAHLTPLRHLHKAVWSVGGKRISVKFQFLVMFAIRYSRRQAQVVLRKFRYAL